MEKKYNLHSPMAREHSRMLNEQCRHEFYHRALEKHAKDKVVLEVGSGTSILSFYALSLGAKFVYCVERMPESVELTDRVLAKHFDRSKFKVIHADFWTDEIDGKIDQKVDILLSELIGPGLFDQGMFHTWDCFKPFMAEGAISIPDRVHFDIWLWPGQQNIIYDFDHEDITIQESKVLNKDFLRSLIEVDSEIFQEVRRNTDDIICRWMELRNIPIEPKIVKEEVLSFTMDQMPEISYSDQQHPRHIQPKVTFDLEISEPTTMTFNPKISFEDDTLDIINAVYIPWKYQPVYNFSKKGLYTFVYDNLDLVCQAEHQWKITINEEIHK